MAGALRIELGEPVLRGVMLLERSTLERWQTKDKPGKTGTKKGD